MGYKQAPFPMQEGTSGHASALKSISPLKQVSPENQAELDRLMAGSEEDTEREEGTGGKNIGLLPSELEDTWVYDGDDIGERINDYEERISFIHEDIWNERPEGTDLETPVEDSEGTDQQQQDLTVLRAELAKLRGE